MSLMQLTPLRHWGGATNRRDSRRAIL